MKKKLQKIKNKCWYKIKALANEAEIFIYEEIGIWGVDASTFVQELKNLNVESITLRINSPGGVVTEGFAIYNALVEHQAKITVHIDGIAASISSIIALAGDEINIADNAFFMIHNPTVWMAGDSEDLRTMAETLEKMKANIIKVYTGKTGLSDEEVIVLMDKESWLNAEEALELGFVDNIIEISIADSDSEEKASFDLSIYNKVPKELLNRIVAKTPTKREIEQGLRDAGLSRTDAKKVTAQTYETLKLRDADKENLRDVDKEKQKQNKKTKGVKAMNKCKHCGDELAHGHLCNCPEAVTEREIEAKAKVTFDSKKEAEKVVAAAAKAETERQNELKALGKSYDCLDLVADFIASNKTVQEFKDKILEDKLNGKPVSQSPEIGLSNKEIKSFSLLKAMRCVMEQKPLEGLVQEASDAVAKLKGIPAKGFYLPHDILAADIRNDLSAGDATKGGFTVGTEVLGGSMIELLRKRMMISRLGATMLTGLVGNISIPKVTGGATSYWLPESGTVIDSDQTFDDLGLTPHRLVGNTAYSKELLMQSSIDVEAFVRDDLMKVLALARDLAAINGSGAAGEPRGILNTNNVGAVTFGAAPTWAKAVEFETDVAEADADVEKMAYLTTAGVRGAWKTTVKVTNQAVFLWDKGPEIGIGEVNGYPAYVSNQVPGNKVLFGNWAELIIAMWAGIDIVVDPFALKKQGKIEITMTEWTDLGLRHPESFSASSDAGNQ